MAELKHLSYPQEKESTEIPLSSGGAKAEEPKPIYSNIGWGLRNWRNDSLSLAEVTRKGYTIEGKSPVCEK